MLDFSILRPLGDPVESRSYLVQKKGGRDRDRWVLKWLAARVEPRPSTGAAGPGFRSDLLDLTSLRHPALALPTQFGTDAESGRLYSLRAYVDGFPLAAHGKDPVELLPWFIQAAEALHLFHRHGFLHRNLRTANFLITPAAFHSRSSRASNVVLCDPAWWPEDRREEESPGGREAPSLASDLCDLGRVFYEVLTQKEPEQRENRFPVPPSQWNPLVSVDIDRLILKLLNPHPARRYRDTTSLLNDLRRLCHQRVTQTVSLPHCFLGRDSELETCRRLLRDLDKPCALAVTGVAGIGKSAFLRRLTLEAQLLGYSTYRERCYPDAADGSRLLERVVQSVISAGSPGRPLRARCRQIFKNSRTASDEEMRDDSDRRFLLRGLLDLFADSTESRPALFILDEAHLADSLTVEFLVALIREIGSYGVSGGRRPPSLVFSVRTESVFQSRTRPLVEALTSREANHLTLELAPLSDVAVEEWLSCSLGERLGPVDIAGVVTELGGHPFAVQERIRVGQGSLDHDREWDPVSLRTEYFNSLESSAREILELLAVLGRPASREFLEELLGQAVQQPGRGLDVLSRDGVLANDEGLFFFQESSFYSWLLESIDEVERKRLHGRIAKTLERLKDESTIESVHHWLHSETPEKSYPASLTAARQSVKNHEYRRALVFYGATLEHLPSGQERLRKEIAEEQAMACARSGDTRRSIDILEGLLAAANGTEEQGRLHGRLGIGYHRAGEIAPAIEHLEKGLSQLNEKEGRASKLERLRIEAELVEILSNRGDLEEAERICGRALDGLATGDKVSAGVELQRVEMVLLENLAHIHLRRFQYDSARQFFERSLRVGEELGAIPERGLILNNLGILHIQENRFNEAISMYRQARKLSRKIGDDLSLVPIYCNLAVLYAKTGETEKATEAVHAARQVDARCDSNKTRFLRIHTEGIVHLLEGNYASGIKSLKEAIRQGEELEDLHTVAFDWAYLIECHLYRGEFKAATAAINRLKSLERPPAPIDSMLRARSTLLSALRGDRSDDQGARREAKGEIPYLKAWNDLYCGWAARLRGDLDKATEKLTSAQRFFKKTKATPGEIQASLELAAVDMARGCWQGAESTLAGLRNRFSLGKGPLRNPILCARLLLYQTRLQLERGLPDDQEIVSLLVEAEGFLVGYKIPDLDQLAHQLRRQLRTVTIESSAPSRALARQPSSSETLVDTLESLKDEAWELIHRLSDGSSEEHAARLTRRVVDFEERLGNLRRSMSGKKSRHPPRLGSRAVIGDSPATRMLAALIEQVAPLDQPTLILGETGTGKELVARVIHEESLRNAGPFLTVSCASLTEALSEAELFGYVQGAFTGAERDHPGLLESAAGGTFLFDEVAEMPLTIQAKLLRVLGDGRVRPLGGTNEVSLDVRYLFSTNRELAISVESGAFRRDLYYRIRAMEIHVPPLRERLGDVPKLVDHFCRLAGFEGSFQVFEEGALEALAAYSWPGNVRELENIVLRLALTGTGRRIRAEDVQHALGDGPRATVFSEDFLRSAPLEELRDQLEREYLVQLHRDNNGDLQAVAEALGIKERALYDRFRRVGLRPGELK